MYVFQYNGPSGETVYAVISPLGLATVWNGTAFVTFVAGNWSTYDIAVTEQGVTGRYFGTWPTLTEGWYVVTIYRQSGGSPATSDENVGSEAIYYTPPSTPAPAALVVAGEWVVPPVDIASPACGPLTTRPADLVRLAFNFGALPQINGGATVSACTISVSPAGPTISDQSIDSHRGYAKFTGGTSGTDYVVTAAVSLSDGTSLNPTGTLRVRAS